MAFLNDGRWIPDNANQRVNVDAGINPQPLIQTTLPNNIGMPQSFPQQAPMMPMNMPQFSANQFNPNQINMGGQNLLGSIPPVGGTPYSLPMGQALNNTQAFQNLQQANQNMTQGNSQFPQVGLAAGFTPPSVLQAANMNDPAARAAFLRSLNPNAQSLSSNSEWRNPYGVQGQGPQAGFVGFQQNGQPANYPPPAPAQSNQQRPPMTSTQGYQNLQQHIAKNQPMQPARQPTSQVQQAPQMQTQQGSMANPFNQQQRQPQRQNQSINPQQQDNRNQYGVSDENAKQDIHSGEDQLQDFLNSLGVYDYEYKDEKYGEGRRISPMAQEIESTPLGKAAISTNDEGYKVVDYGKLGGTMLAGIAMINHKNNALEEEIKSLKQIIMTNLKKGKK